MNKLDLNLDLAKQLDTLTMEDLDYLKKVLQNKLTVIEMEMQTRAGEALVRGLSVGNYYCLESGFGTKNYFKFTESCKIVEDKLEVPTVIHVFDNGAFEYVPVEKFSFVVLGDKDATKNLHPISQSEYFKVCVDLANTIKGEVDTSKTIQNGNKTNPLIMVLLKEE